MRHRLSLLLAGACALVVLFCSLAQASDYDPPMDVAGFDFERLRKDASGGNNRVTVKFNVTAREKITDLRASIEYKDVFGTVVAKAGPSRIGDIKSGQTKPAIVSGLWIPVFNGYLLKMSGRVGTRRHSWTYFGAAGVDAPSFLPPKPIPKTVQGRSLRGAIEGRGKVEIGYGFCERPGGRMVRSGDLKYCFFFSSRGRREELFDLVKDPFERVNLADEPAYAERKAKMRKVLGKHLKETNDAALANLGAL